MTAKNPQSEQAKRILEALAREKLQGRALKDVLREVVAGAWPDMPSWTTIDAPVIEEVQKASVGSGVVLTFTEGGKQKVVLGRAGAHYMKPGQAAAYTIPGGFINLTRTDGSSLVPASAAPEDARTGAAREVEEEFRMPDGTPLLEIDPARLKPMDTKTIAFPNGERRVVIGMMLELTPAEIAAVRVHTARLAADMQYQGAVAKQSVNSASGQPEVESVEIFDLDAVAQGRCNLLHKDQQSLFEIVADHFKAQNTVQRRTTPTQAYMQKVKTPAELATLAAQWAAKCEGPLGITSGVFDIVHPGHISFLEDCKRHSERLVVIIASDRTVRAQKGAEKPYISELKRAQTIAAMDTVDAVIISDELYHETILKAVRPDILFKGDDYKGKTIMGAEHVGKVVLIPCAEKEFYSSSAFAKKIRDSGPKP